MMRLIASAALLVCSVANARCPVSEMVRAAEILVVTPAVRALIRDDKIHQIYSTMQSGKKYGMQTMNDALYGLYMNREVALDDCLRATHDATEFLRMIGQSPEDEAKKPGAPGGAMAGKR